MCEPPSVFRHIKPKARKEHLCYECRGFIPKGEEYHNFSGIWDGKAKTYKVCVDCEKLRMDMEKRSRFSESVPFGFVGEYSSEDHDLCFPARFLATMRKRKAKIHSSWEKLESYLSNT